jgi:hypothetical protein
MNKLVHGTLAGQQVKQTSQWKLRAGGISITIVVEKSPL